MDRVNFENQGQKKIFLTKLGPEEEREKGDKVKLPRPGETEIGEKKKGGKTNGEDSNRKMKPGFIKKTSIIKEGGSLQSDCHTGQEPGPNTLPFHKNRPEPISYIHEVKGERRRRATSKKGRKSPRHSSPYS